jgi:hypothetical protein
LVFASLIILIIYTTKILLGRWNMQNMLDRPPVHIEEIKPNHKAERNPEHSGRRFGDPGIGKAENS